MEKQSKTRGNIFRLLLLVIAGAALTGLGCRNTEPVTEQVTETITVWGLWQESADFDPVIKAFTESTGIEVEYKKIASISTYEKELLSALAEGKGPDAFTIHHTWVDSKLGIMSPAPDTIVDERAVGEEFVDVVKKDVVRDGQVWALPHSVDTLALYYNKDLLNGAGVAKPPSTWNDFQKMVERVSNVTNTGVIQQSAAALGTAQNVNRAPDILQLMMLQSGMKLVNSQNDADVNNDLGARAVTFYTDFANKSKSVFTWDLSQDFSIDAFASGKAATMINYSYHLPTIKSKNPRLNFAVAPVPQISGSADNSRLSFAAYWPFAVAQASESKNAAWTFVRYLASLEGSTLLNDAQQVPPARRDAVDAAIRNPDIGVFAESSLIATTWPRYDIAAIDAIFNTMIDDVITGSTSLEDGLARAESQLNLVIPTANVSDF